MRALIAFALLSISAPATAHAPRHEPAGPQGRAAFADYVRQASAFAGSDAAFGAALEERDRPLDWRIAGAADLRARRDRRIDNPYFRLSSGRFLHRFAPRAVRRPLEGGRLVAQPNGAGRQTFSVYGGVTEADDLRPDHTGAFQTGLAWSLALGSATVTAQGMSGWLPGADPDDDVASTVGGLAFEAPLVIDGHRLRIQTEFAGFHGDVDDGAKEASDSGLFAEVTGESPGGQFTWLGRFERYGDAFAPVGGMATPGRASAEAAAGWDFGDGVHVSGRLQRFEEGLGSDNPTENYLAGADVSAPLPGAADIRATLGAWMLRGTDRADTKDERIGQLEARFETALGDGWTGRAGGAAARVENTETGFRGGRFELSLRAERRFKVAGLDAYVAPEAVSRRADRPDGVRFEAGPGFALGFAGGGRHASFEYRMLADVYGSTRAAQDARVAYAFEAAGQRFAVEAAYVGRDPETAADPHVYSIGLVYSLELDFP